MNALMVAQIDDLDSLRGGVPRGRRDIVQTADKRDDHAVVIRIGAPIHKPHAWALLYGVNDPTDFLRVTPLTEIGHTLDDFRTHDVSPIILQSEVT